MAAAGVALALRSATLLAGRGRPRRGPQPAFVIAGPYRRIRNPLAAGLLLALAGVAIGRGSVVLGAVAVAVAIAAHVLIVRVEEPRLRTRFGSAYAAYLVGVPRWIPRRRRPPRGDDSA